ncbi:NADH:ubiquinone reductase (Na(+)-transporting) subunit F [Conexibacter sp. SYSU D00693]|uniref:NADH:ubiquinone reductase (Na(+)-transporting) subunit F n=1 Tax=Conexibacter sp. SYSU D00693 TaxID=2812560 RepID=UPI00196AA9C9|nr:2Fe-2S iron-sulfur cluster binding domain-containing protein [Conexibacter sp. SYSU D00693]
MPRVVLEPIGVELDCDEDETVLEAAFRQGYNLVHGCREGQCTACKSFLLEGDVSLEPYSTFALSDSEEAQGYTLLCRALPDSDLVVELLHVDEDALRLEHPIREGRARVAGLTALTHDIVRLDLDVLEPADFAFTPGQYVDVGIPGDEDGATRSFSMANLPAEGRLELVVKRYPGGRFSGLLDPADPQLAVGDELAIKGPYGAMHLRDTTRPVLLVAGGSGIGPVLSLLRRLAQVRSTRPVRFFYGARTRDDLLLGDEVAALGAQLADFAYVPVLSEDVWDGATGLVHEAAAAALAAGEVEAPEVYTCGPPPMVEALQALLTTRHGVPDADIAFDKFTTAAETADL